MTSGSIPGSGTKCSSRHSSSAPIVNVRRARNSLLCSTRSQRSPASLAGVSMLMTRSPFAA